MALVYSYTGEALRPVYDSHIRISKHNGTNVKRLNGNYDNDTGGFKGSSRLLLPLDLAAGTVTFGIHLMADAAQAFANFRWRFSHYALSSGENYDGALGDVDSGDIADPGTIDLHIYGEWTETIANLGWSAEDLVYFSLERITPTGGNNNRECSVMLFTVNVPTA